MTQPTPQGTPQTDPQQAGQVDLKPVEAAFAAALLALLLHWAAVKALWVTSFSTQIVKLLSTKGVDSLTGLDVNTEQATQVVHTALVQYAKTAAAHVVSEAATQGVAISPAEIMSTELEKQAKVAVDLLSTALKTSAVSEAARVHPTEATIKQVAEEAAAAASPDRKPTREAVKAAEAHVREAAAQDTASKVEQHLHTLTDAQVRYVLGAVLMA